MIDEPTKFSITGKYLTTDEVASSLGISPITVREAYRKGNLRGHTIAEGPWNRILVTRQSMEEYRLRYLRKRK